MEIELAGFSVDQVQDVEKKKGGMTKILGLKFGKMRMRHNMCPRRADSLTRALALRNACPS